MINSDYNGTAIIILWLRCFIDLPRFPFHGSLIAWNTPSYKTIILNILDIITKFNYLHSYFKMHTQAYRNVCSVINSSRIRESYRVESHRNQWQFLGL